MLYLGKCATLVEEIDRDPETFAIIGAAMEVHNTLGNGFLEAVYQDALEHEFTLRRIPFHREYGIPVFYKGLKLSSPYRGDFVCYETIIVEIKAVKRLTEVEDAQVLHYLKATGFTRALLFNFATPRLQYKRMVNYNQNLRSSVTSVVSTETRS